MNTNKKILEGQHESVVSEKLNMQHQLDQLKRKSESQKLQIIALQREIHSFKESRMKIADKFNLLQEQEKVRDTVVGSLKRKFEEQVTEFLNDQPSGNGDHKPVVFVEPADHENNQISFTAASSNSSQIDAALVAGATNNEIQLIENIAGTNNEYFLRDSIQLKTYVTTLGHNQCHTTKSRVHGRTEVSSQRNILLIQKNSAF